MTTVRPAPVLLLTVALLVLACGATSATPGATATTPPGSPAAQTEDDPPRTPVTTEVTTLALSTPTAEPATADVADESSTPTPTATAALGPPPEVSTGTHFYVAPNGSPGGNGSLAAPWDLATALAHPDAVQPGDTIWLRGGTYIGIYRSNLSGSPGAPVIVRSYPGEWAVIDTQAQVGDGDSFIIQGSWAHYRDFELTNTRTSNRSGGGFVFAGNSTHNKFINMIIHDLGNNTFRDGNEIYGSILYNNGEDGSGMAHQLYTQNDDPANPVRIIDSIVFNGFAYGMHAYAGGVGQLRGIHMIGSVWFNNGVAQSAGENRKDNILVGGVNGTEGILLWENLTWGFNGRERNVALGRYQELNGDVTLLDNYMVGETALINMWQATTMTDNTFFMFNGSDSNVDETDFPDNAYLSGPPNENQIFIRPNQYEPGRAHIVVYNWELEDTVEIDLAGLLLRGDSYEVRNAQNYFAPPVAAGTYEGEPITLPLTGLEPAQPVGPGMIDPSEYTGKSFNVFVLMKTRSTDDAWNSYLPFASGGQGTALMPGPTDVQGYSRGKSD